MRCRARSRPGGEPDAWFDPVWNCFWFNAHPNWGSLDPGVDDDPGLDLDDTDGAGPEHLNLALPEATTYRVGVHYWADHGCGPSFATLRVYLGSEMVLETPSVELKSHDVWDALTIEWPSGEVTVMQQDDALKITPNDVPPAFVNTPL